MENENNLEYICLHQMSKKTDYHIPMEGKGNCNICQPSEENKLCSMYYPIKLRRMYIVDNNESKKEE